MKSPPPSRNKRALNPMLRRMGMSLSLLGAVALSAGLAASSGSTGKDSGAAATLLLASGIIVLVTGILIWYGARRSS